MRRERQVIANTNWKIERALTEPFEESQNLSLKVEDRSCPEFYIYGYSKVNNNNDVNQEIRNIIF